MISDVLLESIEELKKYLKEFPDNYDGILGEWIKSLIKMMEKHQMIRICFKCQIYIQIKPESPENTNELIEFNQDHSGHSLSTINKDELSDIIENKIKKQKFDSELLLNSFIV